uniref:Uncharacterized protein n=1 Tax=Arundo donax TaxID=35708 RepID=A0A0A9B0W8_ARUDO
MHAQMLQD